MNKYCLNQEYIHEGVRYSCDSCDYKATTTSHLKNHKESIHEGIKYSCDQCVYTASWRTKIAQHRKRKH